MNYQKGDFVHLQNRFGDDLWIELLSNGGKYMSPQEETAYKCRSWRADEAVDFTFAPETAHKGWVVDHLRLDPAVAVIFRSTMKD